MKQVIFSIFLFYLVSAFGQNDIKKIVIAIANETDTLSVEHYDVCNRLVFEKIYPFYKGIAEMGIVAFSYNNNNKLIKKISLDASTLYMRFDVYDYEYDSSQNIGKIFIYGFYSDFDDGISFILSKNSIKDIEESTTFKETIKQGGYMYGIQHFRDSLLIKEIHFYVNGDTLEIIDYSYNDQNLLIIKNETVKYDTSRSSKHIYTYDSLRRILSEAYYTTELRRLYKYDYETSNIIKKIGLLSDGRTIFETEIKEYKDNMIVKYSLYYNFKQKEDPYRVISYEYDEENQLIKEINSFWYYAKENYPGFPITIKYIHVTN